MTKKPTSIDEYIAGFPADVQKVLQTMRTTIRKALPRGAEEVISYAIPCLKLDGAYVIYFAGWKEHVSLYPIPTGTAAFQKQLTPYKGGKGTIKFPLDKPLPLTLITKIVTFRAKEASVKTKKR